MKNLNSNISGSSCRVYALDYGIEQEANFDILVPAEDKHNNYPSLAYRIIFQVAQLLDRINSISPADLYPKSVWRLIYSSKLLLRVFSLELLAKCH